MRDKRVEQDILDTCSDPVTGNSALMYAVMENKTELINRLISAGSSVDISMEKIVYELKA